MSLDICGAPLPENRNSASEAAPTVSVLVPLYNSSATISRAIRSAQTQTMRNIEILVADDASTDDGAAQVAALAREDPRIRVFRLPENGGKPHAMNLLGDHAGGEYLAVLDADDAYRPERLEILVGAARRTGAAMAADNLTYIDSGTGTAQGGFGRFVRHGFDPASGDRMLAKQDLLRETSSFGNFDLGILKPVIRRDFALAHGLRYYEHSRLAEDFCYLLEFFVAGGTAHLTSRPLYDWTMPFGPLSRRWTQTGAGPWRYDYGPAIAANRHFIGEMTARGEIEIAAMLRRRGRQYQVMVHYIGAQRQAEAGRWAASATTLLRHPATWGLLARRITGRLSRALNREAEA